MSVYVFLGPTLSVEDARAELGETVEAIFLPPVSQGDIFRVGLKGPRAIGIVDGYFEGVPAVWHKEILWALARGIYVYGSSSMGALRAAELAPFGMVGVGKIFDLFRDDVLEDDDEVAVAHGRSESGYLAQSEAMVSIRSTLAAAEAALVIDRTVCAALERTAKDLFYSDRSYPLVLRRGAEQGLPAEQLDALRAWLSSGRIDQKREDALAMLRALRDLLATDPASKQVDFTLEQTVYWDKAMSTAGEADLSGGAVESLTLGTLLEEVRLQAGGQSRADDGALLRQLALDEARRVGILADEGMAVSAARRFREARGLTDPARFEAWLAAQHLTVARFEELMREEAAIERLRPTLERRAAHRLLDDLRVRGEYADLAARALDKARLLNERGLESAGLEATGLTFSELLAWYFERLGQPVPKGIAGYAKRLGFADAFAFVRAVIHEYSYVKLKEEEAGRANGAAHRLSEEVSPLARRSGRGLG